ncbi:MAG: response regulator [Chloroflexia bacterium]|nr:response regulator [Chloroflexia bacterium]
MKQKIPDLMLLDIMMPVMNGFEVCERMKKDERLKEIPIIIISAVTESSDKVEALKLGAVDYVTKPFQKDELLLRINTHLSLKEKELKLAIANKKLEKYKRNLEDLVKKRTDELQVSNIELQKANEELKKQKEKLESTITRLNETQARLIHSEKMASLGVLVAGVAHEINNPVNYINSSMQGFKNNLEFLQGYSKLYGQISKSNQDIIDEIIEKENNISLEQLTKMLKKSAELIEVGIDRTTKIVKSLKSFTRSNQDKLEAFDIKENLENTLIILHSYYKDRIEIIKEYDQVPMIECYTGKLNQVFLNVLINAMQAIKKKGKIWITAGPKDGKNIFIKIKDTGVGIKQEDLDHVFETFYTTKEKEKGSGLGLAISHNIIKEHNGQIEVESEHGEGTSFTIVLPIKQ